MTKERLKRIIREMSIEYIVRISVFYIRKIYLFFSPVTIFFFKNRKRDYEPVEGEYSGYMNRRMSERGIELYLMKKIIQKWNETNCSIIEVGAVSPYGFPNSDFINDIIDPYDNHEKVTRKIDLFEFDFTGYNVISISTIEHVGLGDYGLNKDTTEKKYNAIEALKKILSECDKCLITFPIGYNKQLDKYVYENFKGTLCYKRGKFDNNWIKCSITDCRKTKYSRIRYADAICVIEK